MGQMSAAAIRAALQDANYPASKEVLVGVAARVDTGEEVRKAVRSLPLGTYDNIDEVVRSLDTVEATGQPDADKAVRARERSQSGLAEHMRDAQAPRLAAD